MKEMLSILPPILTLIIALKSKNIIVALFTGIVTCSLIVNGIGFLDPIINDYMRQGITGNLDILIMLFIFGMFLTTIKHSGGFAAFISMSEDKIKTARSAKTFTWLLAAISSEGTMSTVGVGSIMRPITDKYKVSHEKLGYILSSTGPAMCAILPWTIYILFYSGLIQSVNPELNGISEFMKLIPFNFYAIGSVLIALLYCLEVIPDFGYMKKCEQRAQETGELIRPGSMPMGNSSFNSTTPEGVTPDIFSFILPFGVAIGSVLVIYIKTGMITITTPFFTGLLVGIIYAVIRGYIKIKDIPGILFEGSMGMVPIIVILTLAFTFGKAVTAAGFAEFIVNSTQGLIKPQLLPFLTCLICGICSFATGSLISGLVILAPISITLASAIDANMTLALAACLGGAMFGDQTSPLSDMVVEASMGADIDTMDLAKAHLPIKSIVFVVTCLIYLVLGFVM